jgi:hypothetical protein
MNTRYLTRSSSGLLVLSGASETYIHEDGERCGDAQKLDIGRACNDKLDQARALRFTGLSANVLEAEALEEQVKLLASEEELETDPAVSAVPCATS